MTYWPIFWDIETTGLNPLAQEFWSETQAAQVTAVGLGTIRNWDEGPEPSQADYQVECVFDEDEYRLLDNLADRATALDYRGEPFLVGYNSRQFDHPYIGARYSRFRLDGGPFVHGWKRLDMMRVAGSDPATPKRYPKEGEYASALGVEVEDPYDGSDMPGAFKNGEWDKIITHVEADVEESMRMFVKRKGRMMEHFFDHYDIEASGPPVKSVRDDDFTGHNTTTSNSKITDIELDLGDEE